MSDEYWCYGFKMNIDDAEEALRVEDTQDAHVHALIAQAYAIQDLATAMNRIASIIEATNIGSRPHVEGPERAQGGPEG